MIQDEKPNIINEIDSNKIEIKVADLSPSFYDRFMKYTQNWLNKIEYSKDIGDLDSKRKSVDYDNSKGYLDEEQMNESGEESQEYWPDQDEEYKDE